MKTTNNLIASLLLLLISSISYAQENNDPILENGVYFTYNDFRNNKPSIEYHQLTEESKKALAPRDNRMEIGSINQIHYKNPTGEIEKIKTKDVWGVCINGQPYIAKDMSVLPPRKIYFFKIVTVGQLSRYFTVETNVPVSSILEPNGDKALSNNIASRYYVKEYVIDFKSGRVLDLNKDFRKIRKIIRKDNYFKNVKIKKKNADLVISQYNERNPIQF